MSLNFREINQKLQDERDELQMQVISFVLFLVNGIKILNSNVQYLVSQRTR